MLENCLSDAGSAPPNGQMPFGAKKAPDGAPPCLIAEPQIPTIIGFLGRQTHFILAIDACLILHPSLKAILTPLQDWALIALEKGDTGRIQVNMLDEGADITLLPDAEMPAESQTILASAAAQTDLLAAMVRLSIQQPDSQSATPLLAPKSARLSSFGLPALLPPAAFYRLARQVRPQ